MTGQLGLDDAVIRLSTELDDSKNVETYLGLAGAWKFITSKLKAGIDSDQLKSQDIIDLFDNATDGKQSFQAFPWET